MEQARKNGRVPQCVHLPRPCIPGTERGFCCGSSLFPPPWRPAVRGHAMTEPEVLEGGPNRPGRRPVVVALVAAAAIVVLLAVWATRSRTQPVPSPTPSSAPTVPSATPHRLDPGAIFIQTAVPGPE